MNAFSQGLRLVAMAEAFPVEFLFSEESNQVQLKFNGKNKDSDAADSVSVALSIGLAEEVAFRLMRDSRVHLSNLAKKAAAENVQLSHADKRRKPDTDAPMQLPADG